MQMENSATVEEILRMIENEVTEKDIEYVYIFLNDMYDNLTENEILIIAHALEKIDKGFYDNE